jgi:thioredoxin reductase
MVQAQLRRQRHVRGLHEDAAIGEYDGRNNVLPTIVLLDHTQSVRVFPAGDARLGSSKQLVSAAGEGATAALMIRHYLQFQKMISAAVVEQPEE